MIFLEKQKLPRQSISIQFWFPVTIEIQFLDAQNDKYEMQKKGGALRASCLSVKN